MRQHWKTIAVILLLAAVLTFFLHGLMKENFVGPLMYLVWVGQLVFESIPQIGVWIFFLLVALVIALRTFYKKDLPKTKIPYPNALRVERIGTWAKAIRQADEDVYYQWQLAQQLQKLTVEALANDERVTRKEIRHRLEQGQIEDMPLEIKAYLQAGMTSFNHYMDNKSRFGLGKKASPLDLDPAQVIEYLEEKIEHHTH